MGELEASCAVVLRKTAYRDSDVIVTLLTERYGKISALARAARKSKRRFAGALEMLTVSQVALRERRGAQILTLASATVQCSYLSLATDMARFAPASYATELVRELTVSDQPVREIFDLLVGLYDVLAAEGANRFVMRVFEMRLLDCLGLAPEVAGCIGCQRLVDTGEYRFLWDPTRGGLVCLSCSGASRTRGVKPISLEGIGVLQAAKATSTLSRADPGHFDDEPICEARDAMLGMISTQIGKPLRSLAFIRKIQGFAANGCE